MSGAEKRSFVIRTVVRVPSESSEDRRHLHRTLGEMKRDRTRQINRIKGLLKTQGVALSIGGHFLEHLEGERTWDDRPLPLGRVDRVQRAHAHLRFVMRQIHDLENARSAAVRLGEGELFKGQLDRLGGVVEHVSEGDAIVTPRHTGAGLAARPHHGNRD